MAWGYRAGSFASASGVYNGGGSSDDLHVAFGAALSSADYAIIVSILYPSSGSATPSAPTVLDDINGSYTLLDSAAYTDGTTHVLASVHAFANSASGTPSARVRSANTNQGAICCAAYSGLTTTISGSTDGTAHGGPGPGGTAASGNTAVTTAANELVLGIYADDGWTLTTISGAGTGYTQRGVLQNNSFGELQLQDVDSGSSGVAQASSLASGHPGGSSATWAEFCIVIKLAGGGGGPTPAIVDVIGRGLIPFSRT